jgi:hypothetical protein
MGCAQLKVTGSGAGKPGPTVKFPGAYDPRDPGILVNMCMCSHSTSFTPSMLCTYLIVISHNRLAPSATIHPSWAKDLAGSVR